MFIIGFVLMMLIQCFWNLVMGDKDDSLDTNPYS